MTEGSERDSSKVIVNDVAEGERHVILTGDRPTGPLHLGHYHGSLKSRVRYQERFTQYILIADVQALTDNAENPGKVSSNVLEVALDYLSVGIDPSKTTIYVQSAIPETAELTMYYLNLVNLGKLSRNPTVKTEIKQKGFGEEVPVGFLTYPVNQAADISQFRATLVPVGLDQVPMIEITNYLVRTFNRIYQTDFLVECKALVSDLGLLPGTDGGTKMSKSLNNAIYLSDLEKAVATKVKGMFTDPNHLRVEDPGTVEGNPVFSYLDAFDPEKERLEAMKAHYRRGGLGDGLVKKRLLEVLNEMLGPIRAKRTEYEKDRGQVLEILKAGTEKARGVVAANMDELRKAMGIRYF